MKQFRKCIELSADTRIMIEYSSWSQELEDICSYFREQQKQIIGYGRNKQIYKLKVCDILYFEAVGEFVFGYTKDAVYEIKSRLYQIEEDVRENHFLRASKSMVINLQKVSSVKPAMNGRMYATMLNGEDIMISRQYAKQLSNTLKSA